MEETAASDDFELDPDALDSDIVTSTSASSMARLASSTSGQKRSRNSPSLSNSNRSTNSGEEYSYEGGKNCFSSSSSPSFSSTSTSSAYSANAPSELGIFSDALRARQHSLMQGLPFGTWNAIPTASGLINQQEHSCSPQMVGIGGGLPSDPSSKARVAQSTYSPSVPSLYTLSPPISNNTTAANAADVSVRFQSNSSGVEWATSSRDRVKSLAQFIVNTTSFIAADVWCLVPSATNGHADVVTHVESVTRAAHCMNSSIEMPILGGMPIDTALKTWAEANAHPMSARPLDDPCAGLPGKVLSSGVPQWNDRFMSYSLLAATVNAARGELPTDSNPSANAPLSHGGNGSKKRSRNRSRESSNSDEYNSSGASSTSSEHPISSTLAVTPQEIVAAALNLGASFGVPIMLVANSGAMSSACLCFYASKPMAQPSGLVKKIEMKVEAVASASLFASRPADSETNNSVTDAAVRATTAATATGGILGTYGGDSNGGNSNSCLSANESTIAQQQRIAALRSDERRCISAALGTLGSDSEGSSFPTSSIYAVPYHAPHPRDDKETNPAPGSTLKSALSGSTGLQGSVSLSSALSRFEVPPVDSESTLPPPHSSSGNSAAETNLHAPIAKTGNLLQSPLFPLHAGGLSGGEMDGMRNGSSASGASQSDVNESSSSTDHQGLQSANNMANPFFPMTDPRGNLNPQNAVQNYPYGSLHGYPYGYAQLGYSNCFPPSFVPPYQYSAAAATAALRGSTHIAPLGSYDSQRSPLLAAQAPPPQLNSGLLLNQSMPPAWSVPPQSGEGIPQGPQYHTVSQNSSLGVPQYHLVSNHGNTAAFMQFETGKEPERRGDEEGASSRSSISTRGDLRNAALSSKVLRSHIEDSDNFESTSSSRIRNYATGGITGSSSRTNFISSQNSEHQLGHINDDAIVENIHENGVIARPCYSEGCRKGAQGATNYCIAHGGGRRCTVEGCRRGARDKMFCAGHGGGKRCSMTDCLRSAVGKAGFCTAHGGGKRCTAEGCTKSAQSSTTFCVRHGGGRQCKMEGCVRVARGRTELCASHGGGVRCKVFGCGRVVTVRSELCRHHHAAAASEF